MTPAADEAAIARLTSANTQFALDIYRDLAAANGGNIIIGPHSISGALAMLYVGARGSTADEMSRVMHLDAAGDELASMANALDLALATRSHPGVVDLRVANQAFAQPGLGFVDTYLESLSTQFGAPLAELDFADPDGATNVINKWAADRTNGRVDTLFPDGVLTPQTVLVLANAVSMDAAWKYQFDPAHTQIEPFHAGDRRVTVQMMHYDLYMPLVWTEEYAAVELPYGSGDLSMVAILPEDLAAFESSLDAGKLDSIFGAISEQGIHLSLPKFSFKLHTELDATLKRLGMTSIYASADLSGMLTDGGFFLQTVQHEAFIEIDEDGTEAHAATGVGVAASHGPTITFDRPFLFVIRDRPTSAVLFLGRVTDPSI